MTYKETLFFIGKSLTINKEIKNKIWVEAQLKDNLVDWDAVVKVSTGHFVFPALYCNLKKANFLHYVPADLVAYMEHVTDLNRERNKKILAQIRDLNGFLLKHDIIPIFLKGSANLIDRLYDDIGERMLGDIDFIVSKNSYIKTIKVLKDYDYKVLDKNVPEHHRHYYPLGKKYNVASVEIHKDLLREKYTSKFNFVDIQNNLFQNNEFTVMSYYDHLQYGILVHQINDYGIKYNSISLRNAYDIFLISKKVYKNKSSLQFKHFNYEINCFLSNINQLLHIEIPFLKSKQTIKHTSKYIKLLENKLYRKLNLKILKTKLLNIERMNLLLKSIYIKSYRHWLKKKVIYILKSSS